jgi:hypothetical protein
LNFASASAWVFGFVTMSRSSEGVAGGAVD